MNAIAAPHNATPGPVAHELNNDVVLSVTGVYKKFCRDLKRSLWYGAGDMMREVVTGRRPLAKLREGEFWAVRDATFELRRGQSMGLVGRNGAGKTTLLRMIAGVIRPDRGKISVRGRVAPLLSLGAGFKPILSGRENIFVNMSMLGLNLEQIKERFQSVLEFAELQEAIDAPVQTYSKGMRARLGFSCAVHVDPDIFIIDEALAVGDLQFRMKCYRRLAELRNNGVSLIVVSHNPHILTAVCDRAAYLRKGHLVTSGAAHDVVAEYRRELEESADVEIPLAEAASTLAYSRPPRSTAESAGADIVSVDFGPADAECGTSLFSGEPAVMKVGFHCHRTVRDANVWIAIKKRGSESQLVLSFNSRLDGSRMTFAPGRHEISLEMPYCGLAGGSYMMKTYIEEPNLAILDTVDWSDLIFQVQEPNTMLNCGFYQPRNWTFRRVEEREFCCRAAS
ncbi:MAG: ABC transporter ATP-binding protein [Planctomycetaceae bacterium]